MTCHFLHLAGYGTSSVYEDFRPPDRSEISGELLQFFRIVHHVASYLEYLYLAHNVLRISSCQQPYSDSRISLMIVWADTTLFAASGMTMD